MVVLLGALAELAACAACVVSPPLGAPAAAALYLVFAGLVAAQLRFRTTGSCGCLGTVKTPPSRFHVGFNLVLAALSLVAAASRPAPVATLMSSHPAATAVAVAAAAAGSVLLVAAVELVPAALGAYRRPTA